MRPRHRHGAILSLLANRGELGVDEVCCELAVSPATVRRDFLTLASEGLAEKVWGGLRVSGELDHRRDMLPSRVRETMQSEEKSRIAKAAASLIRDGDILLIEGGTTTLGLAPHLADRPVRILTNSILIAHRIDALRTSPQGAEVSLTGGMLHPGSGLLVGPKAAGNLAEHHATWAILSVGGLDREGGTNTNDLVAESERAMIRASERTMVLADSSTWSRRERVRAFRWGEISCLVTDRKPPAGAVPPGKILVADH